MNGGGADFILPAVIEATVIFRRLLAVAAAGKAFTAPPCPSPHATPCSNSLLLSYSPTLGTVWQWWHQKRRMRKKRSIFLSATCSMMPRGGAAKWWGQWHGPPSVKRPGGCVKCEERQTQQGGRESWRVSGSSMTVLRCGRANLACFTQELLEEESKVSHDFNAIDYRLVSELWVFI